MRHRGGARFAQAPALAALLFTLAVAAAGAQSAVPSGPPASSRLEPPRDDRSSWAVGFAVLEDTDLEARNLYLAYSVPLMVRERLEGIREHTLSADERLSRGREVIAAKVRELSASLIAKRRERDALAAKAEAGAAAVAERAKKEDEIELLAGEVKYLRALDPAEVGVAERKPVEFRAQAAGATDARGADPREVAGLLQTPRYSPLERARSADLDLLVFGSIQQVQEYLFLTVRAVDFPRGLELVSYQDVFAPADLYASLDELAGALAGVVLGREWGSLRVAASPTDALITVAGEFAGVGEALEPFAEPGEIEVSIARSGYGSVARTVTVTPGGRTVLDVALEPVEEILVTVASTPPLADVYVDSRWIGRTPVEVPRPVGLERIELRKEGYERQAFHLSAQSPLLKEAVLAPHVIDPDVRQQQARDALYRWAGAWLVTLPIPIFCWVISVDQANILKAEGAEASLDLYRRYNVLYAGYLGGLTVNLSLAAFVVYRLVRYMIAADRPAG